MHSLGLTSLISDTNLLCLPSLSKLTLFSVSPKLYYYSRFIPLTIASPLPPPPPPPPPVCFLSPPLSSFVRTPGIFPTATPAPCSPSVSSPSCPFLYTERSPPVYLAPGVEVTGGTYQTRSSGPYRGLLASSCEGLQPLAATERSFGPTDTVEGGLIPKKLI